MKIFGIFFYIFLNSGMAGIKLIYMDVKLAHQVKRRRMRSPVGAGIFYPEDRKELLEYMQSFGLEEGAGGRAQAIIAPHGAWKYCGELLANAFYSAIGRSDDIKRVVILGPIHDKREKGLFLSNSHYFQTPLGNIPVDQEITEEILFTSNHFEINDIPHLGEHSIEILLPFVKYCFPHASIVPILMGQPGAGYIYDLSQALKTVFSYSLDETLIVVSCNLSCDKDQNKARQQAKQCLELFSKKDAVTLASSILDGRLNACGGALVVSLLDSGILDRTHAHYAADNIVSAIGVENNTVFYSEVFFE